MTKFSILLATLLVSSCAIPVSKHPQRTDPNFNWHIVGGSDAPEGAYPYQVSLRGPNGVHGCGGSILDQNTILTVAHCVYDVSASNITVVVGSNKLNSGGIKHRVSEVKAHEDFNIFTITNDIAILKLTNNIEYSDYVQPIALETEDVGAGVSVVLSGWGTTSYSSSYPNDLQFINLVTISNRDCKAWYFIFPPVTKGNICTLTRRGEGACKGDSGSPLVSNGKLVGFNSWGLLCAVGFPDVYTRVSTFSEWISQNRN